MPGATSLAAAALGASASTITFLGTNAFIGALESIALTAGLSFASQELLAPDVPNFSQTDEGLGRRLQMSRNPARPQRLIYGRTKVGADLTFFEITNNKKTLHMVGTFAGHECEEIESVFLDDDEVQLDGNGNATGKFSDANVQVNKHRGNQTTADSDLVSNTKLWTEDHVGNNICYVYVKVDPPDNQTLNELFPSGMPQIKGIIKGKNDIFDPRDSTQKFTDNPALCARDFFVDTKFGYGATSDQVNTTSVENSANICEEQVDGQDRYTCNGTIRSDARNDSVMTNLLSSMAGTAPWTGGELNINAGAWRAPVNDFDENHVVGSITHQTKRSRDDLLNTVRGKFVDPDRDWQPTSFPEVQKSQFVNEDDGIELARDVTFNFTTNEQEAQRIALIMLKRNRYQKTLETAFDIEAFNVSPDENITFSFDRYGYNQKAFNVRNWEFVLEEDDEGAFAPSISVNMKETDQDVFLDETLETTPIRSPALRIAS